ncbi:MAG: alpha/beta fold hydrolase [Actinobacteria bacterium]|nr:alpha/beta fold hydrolase [Actinomycetota bacterium]
MPWFDMPLEQLREYRTQTAEPAGLDDWWARRIEDARRMARPPVLTRQDADLYEPLEVYDAEFSGAGGDRIRGWYLKPGARPGTASSPVVVQFIGYGGGRGAPSEHLMLPALGYTLLVMDSRGQGGRWTIGATGDAQPGPENSQVMTRGITSAEDYYYTRLFTDAVLAVDAALELSGGNTVAVSGGSQGGGLALAAAALRSDAVATCHADVPFLCDIQRAITLTGKAPYSEIPEFLSQNVDLIPQALDTLRYVDCALLARRIRASCLLSTGLMDEICPPSTVFAAYNEITAEKDIAVYPFSGHAGPHSHVERKLRHLREKFPS